MTTTRRPRFTLLPTLGLCAPHDGARKILEQGLGFTPVSEDESSLGFHGGKLSFFVDTRKDAPALSGFLPLLAADDLEAARTHFEALGCGVEPLPWADKSEGLLVSAPGGIRFCLVSEDSIHALRHVELD